MKSIIYALILFLMTPLSVCANSVSPTLNAPVIAHGLGKDGYPFETKEYSMSEVTVRLVIYSDRKKYNEEYRKRVSKGSIPRAFSVLNTLDRSKCSIHTIDPQITYLPDLYGHELMHCFFGQWHPGLDRR